MANLLHRGTYIPQFDLGARFCYFLDLNQPKPGELPWVAQAKQSTFNAAQSYFSGAARQIAIGETSLQNDTISSALTFLENIAQSERNKEIRIIQKYIEDLQKNEELIKFMKKGDKDDLSHLIEDLKNFSDNPTAVDMRDFYVKLTVAINAIRSNVEYLKERISQLSDQNRKTWRDVASDNINFRMGSDIDTALKGALGIQQRSQDGSVSRLIISQLNTFLQKHLTANALLYKNPYAVVVGIMIDFENFIAPQYARLASTQDKKELQEKITKAWEDYEKKEDSFIQELMHETERAEQVLDTIQREMGFDLLKPTGDAYQERIKLLEKQARSATRDRRNVLNHTLKDIMGAQYNPDMEKLFKWNVTTGKNGQHGLIYEIAEALKSGGNKIRGSTATDVLVLDLATIKGEVQVDATRQEAIIQKALERSGEINKMRHNRMQNLSKKYEQANAAMREATDQLNKMLEEMHVPDDIFIYHESLKLYSRVETHKKDSFSGRALGIMNALDSLYTANGIAGLQLIDPQFIYNIAVNLADLAVGGVVRPEVEQYLSIFAGLLMFDDIQNIAKDVADTAALQVEGQGHAYNIHLYLVNGIYVPGSMLLTSVSQALQQGYNKITASAGAKVKIDVSGANSIIRDYLDARASGTRDYKVADWRAIGHQMASQVKVKIHFLTSFLQFIQDLQSYMA